ncbi:MAG TPA: hypothetical protein VFQ39_14965, partial [Longimicrobium sp.]|nr:hypothetical protein [Longimicrobium sp.]
MLPRSIFRPFSALSLSALALAAGCRASPAAEAATARDPGGEVAARPLEERVLTREQAQRQLDTSRRTAIVSASER